MKTIELTPTTIASFDSTAKTPRVSNLKKTAKKCKKAVRKLIETYLDFCRFVKPMYVYEDKQFPLEKEN